LSIAPSGGRYHPFGPEQQKEQAMFALRQRVSLYRRAALCGLCLVLVGSLSARALAQRYKTIPAEKETITFMSFSSAVRNPAGLGSAQADVEKYLKGYHFPKMTLYTAEDLEELGKSREQLFKLMPQITNAGTRDLLNEIIFTYSRGIARGNFHPAVRYNAVLMLGDLDQQAGNPPVPHAKSTAELLELIEQEQFNKIAVPESVKLGALVGLERHTKYGIDPALKDRLTKTMMKVMASPTPEDVDKDVHDWVRGSAALVLANQYKDGPTKEVQAALTGLIADMKMELDDRCVVAGSLGRITYPAGADIDGNATVNALGQLTYDVITEGAKLAEEYQEEALGSADLSSMQSGRGGGYGRGYGGGEYGGRGGYGGGYGGEEDMGPRFERRQVFARLYDVAKGASSLKAGLDDEAKARADSLIASMEPAIQVMEDKDATEVDVSNEVIALQTALTELLNGWGLKLAAAGN
jgi:hypothetical protein